MDKNSHPLGNGRPSEYKGTEAERLAYDKSQLIDGDIWKTYELIDGEQKFTKYHEFSETENDWIRI